MAGTTKSTPLSGQLAETAAALNRAIFMRESQQASRAYEELLDAREDFILAPRLQHDLARLLELGNEPRLALRAYEDILSNQPDSEHFNPALRAAGHLAYRLKQFKKCRRYLERFLGDGNPSNAERMDAESILKRLPDGKGVRPPEAYERPPEANASADDGPPSSFFRKSTQIDLGEDEEEEEPETIDIGTGVNYDTQQKQESPKEATAEDFFFTDDADDEPSLEAGPVSSDVSAFSATPPISLDSRELRSKQQAKDDGMVYALIVPFGTPMNVKKVVEALKMLDGLSDKEANEALRQRKGLIRENMTRSAAVAVQRTIGSIPHKLKFMAIETGCLPREPIAVMRGEVLDPGLRVHTEGGVKKIRWKSIRLVACGRLHRRPVVDIYCGVGLDRYQLAPPEIDFATVIGAAGLEENQAATRLLEQLVEKAPDAIFPRPLLDVVEGKSQKPKKFDSPEEYGRYNRCLVFAHFGTEVEAQRLSD